MYKDLNEVPPSYDWFLYEYIDAEVKKKLDKTKLRFAGDEMEKETKQYVEYLNHNPNWLKKFHENVYAVEQRRRFSFTLPKIDHYTSDSF